MSNKVAFRSSIGGYNRKDVNDYLISRAHETQKLIEQKNSVIAELKDEIARLGDEALIAADRFKGEIREDAGELAISLGSLRSLVDALFVELDGAKAELAQMSVYRAKAEKFDRFASSLSDIFSVEQSLSDAAEPADDAEDENAAFRERAEAEFKSFEALLERLAGRTDQK